MDFRSLILAELVSMPAAPFLVPRRKGPQAEGSDAVHMLKGVDKVHPFLGAVGANRAIKEPVCIGIALIEQGNQVIIQSGFTSDIQFSLAIECFQLISNGIHTVMFPQDVPVVKGIMGNLLGIGLICFGGVEFYEVVIFDEKRIDGADKQTGLQ